MAEVKKMNKDKVLLTIKYILTIFSLALLFLTVFPDSVFAAGNVEINVNGDSLDTVDIILTLTLIALLPSLLIMTTCFTRMIIVLSFLANALGLQQTPPNQVLIAIALFLSLFIMSPVIHEIDQTAYQPYQKEEISEGEFLSRASVPLKEFMLKQTKKEDLRKR